MFGERHALPSDPDNVPEDTDGLYADRQCDSLPTGTDSVPGRSDAMPGNRHNLSAKGNWLLRESGRNGLPADTDAVPNGRNNLPSRRRRSGDGMPRRIDEMSGGRNALSADADKVPAAVDDVRESPDDLPIGNRWHDLHSPDESWGNRGRKFGQRQWTFASAIRDGSLVMLPSARSQRIQME
jgi:hypothetical protein